MESLLGDLAQLPRPASPQSRSSSRTSRSQSSSRRRVGGGRQPSQGRVRSLSKSPVRSFDDGPKLPATRPPFSPTSCSKELALLTQRVAAAETQLMRSEEQANALRHERDKLRAQLTETNKEIAVFSLERGEMQARVLEAESLAASLRDSYNFLKSEIEARIAEATQAVSEATARRCENAAKAKEDVLRKRFEAEEQLRREAQAQNEHLTRERDTLWEQLSDEEQKHLQAESRAVAFEKEWDALRELLATERLRHESAGELAKVLRQTRQPEDGNACEENQEALEDKLHAEETKRKEAEAQLGVVKESLTATSERLAAMEAAEVTNHVLERVLLQRAGFRSELPKAGTSPGDGRIVLLQCLVNESNRADAAQERIATLEQRLGPDSAATEHRVRCFEEECLELERRLDTEQQFRLSLQAAAMSRAETYEKDRFALQQSWKKLDDEVMWQEEAEARAVDLEETAKDEIAAALAAKRAAHKQIEVVQEDSVALWGRLETEQLQRQHDEARMVAMERDARQRIGNFKEDCLLLESKVQAIEQAAKRQIETFSDDCLVLQGRLVAEESRCEEEQSKAQGLEKLNVERLEDFRQTYAKLNREMESLEHSTDEQVDSLTEDCLMLRQSLEAEVAWREQEQSRVEGLLLAACQQREAFHEEYMLVQGRLKVEHSRCFSSEQRFASCEEEAQKNAVLCATLENQLQTMQLEAQQTAEKAENQVQQSTSVAAVDPQGEFFLQAAQREIEALRTERVTLHARLTVEERRRATTDTKMHELQERFTLVGRAPEVASEVSHELQAVQEQFSAVRDRLGQTQQQNHEAQAREASLTEQLRLQVRQNHQAQDLITCLTERLHRMETSIDEIIEESIKAFTEGHAARVSEEMQSLQQQLAVSKEYRQQEESQALSLERAQRSALSAEERAQRATAETREVRRELESCRSDLIFRTSSRLATHTGGSVNTIGAMSMSKLEMDIEHQKQVILGAMIARSCDPSSLNHSSASEDRCQPVVSHETQIDAESPRSPTGSTVLAGCMSTNSLESSMSKKSSLPRRSVSFSKRSSIMSIDV